MRIVVSVLTTPPSQRARLHAQCNRELIRARQLAEMPQRELLEKYGRGTVQQRVPQPLGTSHDIDEPALQQRPKHSTHGDAAYLLDLRPSDGLPVRDDCKRLESGRGESCGPSR